MSVDSGRSAPALAQGRRGALLPAGLALAGVAALAWVAEVDPNQAGHYPTCPFLFLTGWYCPGCGSLRCLHALAHGDVGAALSFNPLTVFGLVAVVGLWAGWAQRRITGRARRAAPGWVLWAVLGVVLAFWVLRNLPGFAWLAP
jgi:hypothetical protein